MLQSAVLGSGEGIWFLIWFDKAVGAEPKEWVASLPGWGALSPISCPGVLVAPSWVFWPFCCSWEVVLGQQPQLKWGWHFPWCRRLVFIFLMQGWLLYEVRGRDLCGCRWICCGSCLREEVKFPKFSAHRCWSALHDSTANCCSKCSWEKWQWESCGIALWFSFTQAFSLTFCIF